ncbi:unnamed protein product [Dicrocoelium dendriticum]|nr:unnamed protein product [Dicrocoelium dendriticum]
MKEKKCDSIENQTNMYACLTIHGNRESVTWDYPENWIGPVRYLKNIAYNPNTTIVQVVGIHWPKKQLTAGGHRRIRESESFWLLRAFVVNPMVAH